MRGHFKFRSLLNFSGFNSSFSVGFCGGFCEGFYCFPRRVLIGGMDTVFKRYNHVLFF